MGATKYIDGNLSSDCTSGNYSIANRNCTGSDGDALKAFPANLWDVYTGGDTVYVRAGTYNVTNCGSGNYSSMMTLSGYGSERPVINNPSVSNGDSFDLASDANNTTFKQLKFTMSRTVDIGGQHIGASSSSNGYIVVDDCEFDGHNFCHIRGGYKFWIKNCVFKNWGMAGYNDHAIYVFGTQSSGNESIIEHNYFEQTQYGGSSIGACVHIYKDGLVPGPQYYIVRNNIMNGYYVWGVLCDGSNNKIYNNSFFSNTSMGSTGYVVQQEQGYTGNEVRNNIFSGSMVYVVYCQDSCPNPIIITNNITNGSSIHQTCSGTITNNITSATIGYTTSPPTAWTDFKLQSNSNAINAGTNLGAGYDQAL